MSKEFFTDDQNLAELVGHMPDEDQQRFNSYGHFRIEAAFVDRIFIVYRPTGLTVAKQHREPDVVTTIKIIDFGVEVRNGCYTVLADQTSGEELTLTHVPRKVFNFPIYASIPPRVTLRWDARIVHERVWRSLSFALLVKTKNKADFYSKGNTYMETPNRFSQLYPAVTGKFKF